MVAAHITRRILEEVARALPEDGHDIVTGLEIRDIWGEAILVRLHTAALRSSGLADVAAHLQAAVHRALGDRRCRVEIAWGSVGTLD